MSHTSPTQRTIDQMRTKADFLARHRELLDAFDYERQSQGITDYKQVTYAQVDTYYWGTQIEVRFYGPQARDAMRQVRRVWHGTWKKDANDRQFRLEREVEGIRLRLIVDRETVCEKRVVTKPVVVPAREASPEEAARLLAKAEEMRAEAEALAADQPEHEELQEVVEWDCASLNDDRIGMIPEKF